MRSIQPILNTLREALRLRYGDRLVQVVLYGSWARGEATGESDIDVMVVLKAPVRPVQEIGRMGDLLTDLLLEHGVLVSAHPISEEDFETRHSPLMTNVRREGVPV